MPDIVEIFNSLLKFYKREYPELRLGVWWVDYRRDYGGTFKINGRFIIKIAKRADEIAAVMLLTHEVAHAISWDTDKDPSDHGPEFGKAYAKVWKKYIKWLNSKD